jgi:hypothetical protein
VCVTVRKCGGDEGNGQMDGAQIVRSGGGFLWAWKRQAMYRAVHFWYYSNFRGGGGARQSCSHN